jgi:hypothetical protein
VERRRTTGGLLFGDEPHNRLQDVVCALNGEVRSSLFQELFYPHRYLPKGEDDLLPHNLQRYIEAWKASGPDLSTFGVQHPEMWASVKRQWETQPLVLWPSDGGTASLYLPRGRMRTAEEAALYFFISLILNPLWERLGGPCLRCGRYYVAQTARKNKAYCSRSCGTRATAIATTRKKRDEEHGDKLQRATDAAQKWATARTVKEWKSWVSSRHPDITVKFLTRAVNNGQLKPPTKREKP